MSKHGRAARLGTGRPGLRAHGDIDCDRGLRGAPAEGVRTRFGGGVGIAFALAFPVLGRPRDPSTGEPPRRLADGRYRPLARCRGALSNVGQRSHHRRPRLTPAGGRGSVDTGLGMDARMGARHDAPRRCLPRRSRVWASAAAWPGPTGSRWRSSRWPWPPRAGICGERLSYRAGQRPADGHAQRHRRSGDPAHRCAVVPVARIPRRSVPPRAVPTATSD